MHGFQRPGEKIQLGGKLSHYKSAQETGGVITSPMWRQEEQ